MCARTRACMRACVILRPPPSNLTSYDPPIFRPISHLLPIFRTNLSQYVIKSPFSQALLQKGNFLLVLKYHSPTDVGLKEQSSYLVVVVTARLPFDFHLSRSAVMHTNASWWVWSICSEAQRMSTYHSWCFGKLEHLILGN